MFDYTTALIAHTHNEFIDTFIANMYYLNYSSPDAVVQTSLVDAFVSAKIDRVHMELKHLYILLKITRLQHLICRSTARSACLLRNENNK